MSDESEDVHEAQFLTHATSLNDDEHDDGDDVRLRGCEDSLRFAVLPRCARTPWR